MKVQSEIETLIFRATLRVSVRVRAISVRVRLVILLGQFQFFGLHSHIHTVASYRRRAFLRLAARQAAVADQPCGRALSVGDRAQSAAATRHRGCTTPDDVPRPQSRVQGSRRRPSSRPPLRHTFPSSSSSAAAAAGTASERPGRSQSRQTSRSLRRVGQRQDVRHGQGTRFAAKRPPVDLPSSIRIHMLVCCECLIVTLGCVVLNFDICMM